MPTYDYICQACGHELEIFHSISDAPRRKCPKCGKLKLQRQIGSGAGIIFKGSGFYGTDYRSKSYEEGKKADSKPAPEKTDKADKKPKDTPAKKKDSGDSKAKKAS